MATEGTKRQNFAYAPDILHPRLVIKTKVLIKPQSNVVSIEPVSEFMQVKEMLL